MKDEVSTVTLSGGSMYDSLTVSDNYVFDLGGDNLPALTSSSISSITLDDLISTTSTITLPNTTWDSSTYTINSSGTGYTYNYGMPSSVHIDGDGLTMKEGSDIKVGGKSLMDAISKIEERLGILKPNPELEERWEKLKDLRNQYIEMEKDLLEKEKIMKILKET